MSGSDVVVAKSPSTICRSFIESANSSCSEVGETTDYSYKIDELNA